MNHFWLFFSGVRWQDVVDISLNSYILFRLYVLFRGTKVFHVLFGIALLWFFQRLSVSVGLIVTSWAIQGITTIAALIIVVVFGNEIRSVLQAKRLKTILWGFRRKTADTPVGIIVESVFEMARRRIGALIVLPDKEDLKEILQTGVPWHGLVSKEMITSIFWPDNPVHDGAAVIEGDRITEVGVILPLSIRKDLPSYYGTRHRAAIGLAEITDALVLVVSEERGSVTITKGSKVIPINRKDQLKEILQEHAGIVARQDEYLKKERVRIGIAAFASFLFVIGIWFSFSRGLEALTTLDVSIEYMNRDPGMEILDASVNSVNVNLSGSGALIKSIRPEQVKVRLDLGRAVAGKNTFTIRPENISLPPGVSLKSVKPQIVDVNLFVPTKKELPIQVDWVGKLPANLILVDAKLNPATVQVVARKRTLENTTTIYTQKVSLNGIQEKTGPITVNLALDPTLFKIAPESMDKITIDYILKEKAR